MTERTHEEIVENIVDMMETYVAPSVAQHGGEVNFTSFDDGNVVVQLSGACSGCSGSTETLKHGIEQMLTQLIPEVTSVQGIDDPNSTVDPFMTEDPFSNWNQFGSHHFRTEEDN
jgi:Fe-S cluster biogenesis protein NfuA|tara:strand:+ start:326 stop:670 length:345 start_codon:yes stop_codon:yes gene_type:complete